MILLHATEAPYAIPGIGITRGDTMFHLLSDIPGASGTTELLAFARSIGGRDAWIQGPGTYREHFDLFGEWAERALDHGAHPATGDEVATALAHKRATSGDWRQPVPAISINQRRALEDLVQQSGMSAGQLVSIEGMRLFELASRKLDMQPADVAPRNPAHVVVLLGTPQHMAMARVATRLLADAGMHVTLIAVADSASTRWWADPSHSWSSQIEISAIMTPDANDLPAADLIIDLLQSWRKAATQAGSIAEVIQVINTVGRPVLSLDLPSGTVFDERGLQRSGVRATATLATLLPLRELSFVAATPLLGEVWLGNLGLSPRLCKRVGVRVGPLFESASLVRLERVSLGDGTISSDISRWVIADI
ncbi:MAG TPA: DUF4031 domain-containing protein [Ktedonobacterales bacterium]|nr:DUF4031 domain-containing protein [Ktedonobacterales bacterium]